MFVLYFQSQKQIYVLHVTIWYSLIVCIEIQTSMNTYISLQYVVLQQGLLVAVQIKADLQYL